MLHQLLYSRVSEGLEKILAAALQRMAILLLLIGLLALSAGCGKTDTQLRVGAHSIDISPQKLPAIRNGGFLQRIEDTVVDPLHARCFVFNSGEETIAIAVVDSCMIPRDVCNEAKEMAHQETGIAVDRILISSTHTHNAPSVMDMCLGANSDPDYEVFLPPKIAEGIARA